MKNIIILLIITTFISCNKKDDEIISNDYRDITNQLSVQDFEKIKTLILDDGGFEPFFNLYVQQPIYTFTDFTSTLLPDIGALNITCDPQLSDYNQLVIYDADLPSKYLYFLIIRSGDLNKESIQLPDYAGLKENKVYLLKYSDYDIYDLYSESEYYITQLKNAID